MAENINIEENWFQATIVYHPSKQNNTRQTILGFIPLGYSVYLQKYRSNNDACSGNKQIKRYKFKDEPIIFIIRLLLLSCYMGAISCLLYTVQRVA